MKRKDVRQILSDTAYVRTGGSREELACAEYLRDRCLALGLSARIEPFAVTVYEDRAASLTVGGREIPCAVYGGTKSGSVRAPLYYLGDRSAPSLRGCRGRIVLVDRPLSAALYEEITSHGAVGFIAAIGNAHDGEEAPDTRELRFSCDEAAAIPGVTTPMRFAPDLARAGAAEAVMTVRFTATSGRSHNVILDLPGESDETVVISAHYDSTALSLGAYDNMSGCIGLLYLAERLAGQRLRRRVRLLFCGSEERGLLGSLAYCHHHKEELCRTVLNINLDMLGCVLGEFVAFSCAEDGMHDLLSRYLARHRFGGSVRYDIRSSDSSTFVYFGVPAVSFARYAPSGAFPIHTRNDTATAVDEGRLLADMRFIAGFAEYVASGDLPPRAIADRIREAATERFETMFQFWEEKHG